MRQFIRLTAGNYIAGYTNGDLPPDPSWMEVFGETPAVFGSDFMLRLVDGEIMPSDVPMLPPDEFSAWDDVSGGWIDARSLQEKRAAKWREIKAARDAEEFGVFVWSGHTFNADRPSVARITGAVVLAMMSPAFADSWTLADNSTLPVNAEQMMAIGAALGMHTSAAHAKAKQIRAQIETATESELQQIGWN